MLDHVQHAREQAIGKRVVYQVKGELQEVGIARVLGAVALQGAEVIRVAEFLPQLLEDRPVALLTLSPERRREVALEVGDDPIVIEQGSNQWC
jgi:hypothetical protein